MLDAWIRRLEELPWKWAVSLIGVFLFAVGSGIAIELHAAVGGSSAVVHGVVLGFLSWPFIWLLFALIWFGGQSWLFRSHAGFARAVRCAAYAFLPSGLLLLLFSLLLVGIDATDIIEPEVIASTAWYAYLAAWCLVWLLAVSASLRVGQFDRLRAMLFVATAVVIASTITLAAVTSRS